MSDLLIDAIADGELAAQRVNGVWVWRCRSTRRCPGWVGNIDAGTPEARTAARRHLELHHRAVVRPLRIAVEPTTDTHLGRIPETAIRAVLGHLSALGVHTDPTTTRGLAHRATARHIAQDAITAYRNEHTQ